MTVVLDLLLLVAAALVALVPSGHTPHGATTCVWVTRG